MIKTIAVVVGSGGTNAYNTFARGCDSSCISTGSANSNGLLTGKFCCTNDFCNNQGSLSQLTTINYNKNNSMKSGVNSLLTILALCLIYF